MIRDALLRRSYRRDEKITMARLLFARDLMVEYGVPYSCNGGVRSPLQLYLGPCRLLLPASDGKSLERPLLNPSKPRPKTKAAPDQPMRLL